MRSSSLLRFIVLLLLVVGAVGYFRGWFSFTIDKDKINDDAQKVKNMGQEAIDKVKTPNPTPERTTP